MTKADPRFYVVNGMCDSIDEPTPGEMRDFLSAVDETDLEHGAACLCIEVPYATLEWNGDGRLVYRIGDHSEARHISDVPRERAVALWIALASGDTEAIEREPWLSGTGYHRTEEEQQAIDAMLRERARAFYDSLGVERKDVPCRHPNCARGAVSLSVFCRTHHYESVTGSACPFTD